MGTYKPKKSAESTLIYGGKYPVRYCLLSEETDPNKLHDLLADIEGFELMRGSRSDAGDHPA